MESFPFGMAYFQVRTVSFTVGILRWRFYFVHLHLKIWRWFPFWLILFASNFHKFPPGVLRENSAVAPKYGPVDGLLTRSSCRIAIVFFYLKSWWSEKDFMVGGNFPKTRPSLFTWFLAWNESLFTLDPIASWNWLKLLYNSVLSRTEIWSSCVADMQLGKLKSGEPPRCVDIEWHTDADFQTKCLFLQNKMMMMIWWSDDIIIFFDMHIYDLHIDTWSNCNVKI